MRVNTREIAAPPIPRGTPWINVAMLKMHEQRGRPVLVEFWDFCRINSRRTLPYLKAWHERYESAGLRVIGIHTGGFACSRDEEAITSACERLGVEYPVVVDNELVMWDYYGNQGWPSRYLFDQELILYSVHYGEGAYEETEREIGELLGIDVDPVPPLRPEDVPGAQLVPQTADQAGAYDGPYEAGGVHLVCSGHGEVVVNGTAFTVGGCDCYTVLEHDRHTAGVLAIEAGEGVEVLATTFTAALA